MKERLSLNDEWEFAHFYSDIYSVLSPLHYDLLSIFVLQPGSPIVTVTPCHSTMQLV